MKPNPALPTTPSEPSFASRHFYRRLFSACTALGTTIIASSICHAADLPAVANNLPVPEAQVRFDEVLATKGETIFNLNCLACHQAGAKGKVGFAPTIRNRDFLALASDDFIRQTIMRGRLGTAMVPRPDLTEDQVDAIIAYLRSLPIVNPVHVEVDWVTRFDGNPTEGEILFGTYCTACHGPKGEGYVAGVPGTAIGFPDFLATASDDYILQTLKLGRMGTPMQPFIGARGLANLSENDAHNIIAFMRTLGKLEVQEIGEPGLGGDPKAGAQHFAINCVACHQEGGIGKVGFAPSIRNPDFLAIASDDFIRRTIMVGRASTAMVPRADLPTKVIDDIIAYLRAIPVPTYREVHIDEEFKCEGDITRGGELFAVYCASCHGAKGEGYIAGVPGPGIGLPGFLNAASDDYIIQTLKRGRVGTPMRTFMGASGLANLDQQQAGDIVVFLRSLTPAEVVQPESEFE